RFHYDALDRLRCSYFASKPSKSCANAAVEYGYTENGNLTKKTDLGETLVYGDKAHPHALTEVRTASKRVTHGYKYDAVGNQVKRPDAPTVTYTAFDLPASFQGAKVGEVTFDYDGDQNRIRKTAADGSETLYFEGLYERVTTPGKGVEDR